MLNLQGTAPAWPEDLEALWARTRVDRPSAGESAEWHAVLADLLALRPQERLEITAGVRPTAAAFAALGRTVLLEAPTFAGVRRAFERSGCPVDVAPLDRSLRNLRSPGETLLWFTSPGRNPDGRTADPGTAAALAPCIAAGALAVQNEIYRWHGPSAEPVAGALRVGSLAKIALLGE